MSGLRDAVTDRGRLVPSGDRESMARACVALIRDAAGRSELVERARESVIAAHSWDAVAARVEAVYRALGSPAQKRPVLG